MNQPMFKIGEEVKILRSNGVDQIGKILTLNGDNINVRVEWCEKGEKKAKDVTIEQLICWNRNESKITASKKMPNRRTIFHQIPQLNTQAGGIKESAKRKSLAVVSIRKINTANEPAICLNNNKRKMSSNDLRTKISNKSIDENGISFSSPTNDFATMIENFRHTIDCNPASNVKYAQVDTKISVCVRKRPLNSKERLKNELDIITVTDNKTVLIHECRQKVDLTKYLENHKFTFDHVFDELTDNQVVYNFTAQPLINCLFDGGYATCFAYGQTGSGKTYTISGDPANDESRGIYDYTIHDVFQRLKKASNRSKQVFISLFEIYSGKIFDLLNNRNNLRMLEDSGGQVQICELVEIRVTSPDEALRIASEGSKLRTSGQTSANINSSRSHSIFQLCLKQKIDRRGQNLKTIGKFSLIDLAGNERGADTANCDRRTRLEGAEINKSLLALKECIRALCRHGAHLPFRASKLTQVLRDSFMSENSKTCMIATVSPGQCCCDNSLNTLRYTDHVKEIGGKRNEAEVSQNKTELELICEQNPNVYKFHKTVNNIYASQEQLYEEHRNIVSNYDEWNKVDINLLQSLENGNKHLDDYVNQVDKMVDIRLYQLNMLKDKINKIKSQLYEEEIISKQLGHLPPF